MSHRATAEQGIETPIEVQEGARTDQAKRVLAPEALDLVARLHAELEPERRELLAALARCGGNKAEVARSLGVQRTTLYYRLKRLGIET